MKIFVGSIPYTATEEDVYSLFAPFGDVWSVFLKTDLMSARTKGYAIIEMAPKAAKSAIAHLNTISFCGRTLTVNQSRSQLLPPRKHESDYEAAARLQKSLFLHYQQRPQAVRFMDRAAFEVLIADLFKAEGFDVELTNRTCDGGYDVVAVRSEPLGLRFLVECKRPKPGGKIGVRIVRELLGVKTTNRATKAILVTTGHFTRGARMLLDDHRWELEGKDYTDLIDWLRKESI